MNYFLPVLAVLLGYFFVIIVKPKEKKNLKLLLAFSGAFLLSLTVFNLLPEVYHTPNTRVIGVLIMSGILLQIFLEFFSKGAEHGHVHINKNNNTFPWLLFFSLCIHSILEGFPIHQHETLIYGIIIHKLPIAIILSTFFIDSEINKYKVLIFLILFSLMTPLGSLIADVFSFTNTFYTYASALVIGILLHISTTILFESSEEHKFNVSKLLIIIIGIIVAYII
jgi:zinc transporter ZupT